MAQKVYISSNKMATFTCPKCEKSRIINVSDHKNIESLDKIRVRCACKHIYRVTIERRKQHRVQTKFPGFYKHVVSGNEVSKGTMVVLDMSRTGLKIKLSQNPNLVLGDTLMLEFHLDDSKRTLIQKEVEIKKIFDLELGVEFKSMHPSNPSDKALGFYMFG